MKLTGLEIWTVHWHLAKYKRAGLPITPSFNALHERFDRALRFGDPVSPTRQGNGCAPAESDYVELIGTRQAAELLGWTIRRVQRHAADLDGTKVGGRLVFPAEAVKQYRDQLDD